MDKKELEKIYNESYRAVYWTAISLMKDEDEAADITQDTFVTLIDSYDTLKDKNKVTAWLKKIAANKCLNRLTRTKTVNTGEEFFDTVEAQPEDFLPDSILESGEKRKIIMNIIDNTLSEDVRRTLILFYFDEMTTKEIAEALDIPQGTVLWRLNFAKKKIKKEVERYETENNDKLYAMALPFLSKLFIKEAELVPLKAIPASLIGLSSAKIPATSAFKATIKKITQIASKKVLIASAASVVAVSVGAVAIYNMNSLSPMQRAYRDILMLLLDKQILRGKPAFFPDEDIPVEYEFTIMDWDGDGIEDLWVVIRSEETDMTEWVIFSYYEDVNVIKVQLDSYNMHFYNDTEADRRLVLSQIYYDSDLHYDVYIDDASTEGPVLLGDVQLANYDTYFVNIPGYDEGPYTAEEYNAILSQWDEIYVRTYDLNESEIDRVLSDRLDD